MQDPEQQLPSLSKLHMPERQQETTNKTINIATLIFQLTDSVAEWTGSQLFPPQSQEQIPQDYCFSLGLGKYSHSDSTARERTTTNVK